MNVRSGKDWSILLIVIVGLLVISSLVMRKVINGIETSIIASKTAHDATATVVRKEYLKFDEKSHTSVDEDGFPVERRAGDEEWRIYYRIDSFGKIDRTEELRLLKAEEERYAKNKPRFRIVSKEQYDYIQKGDRLSVSWHWLGKNKIEIISAGKPTTINNK